MDMFILNTDLFPIQIKEKLNSKQVAVQIQDDNGGILLLPIKEKKDIRNIRGIAKDSSLNVDKFLELTREDIKLEYQ